MRIHVRPYWHKEKTNKQISIDERDTPLLAKVPTHQKSYLKIWTVRSTGYLKPHAHSAILAAYSDLRVSTSPRIQKSSIKLVFGEQKLLPLLRTTLMANNHTSFPVQRLCLLFWCRAFEKSRVDSSQTLVRPLDAAIYCHCSDFRSTCVKDLRCTRP